jgi:hypothetical protein
MLFAQNLRLNPGELSSAVFVRLTLNNSVILQMPAEDVRALRESEFTQVVFRLPTGLRPGTYTRANPRTHTSQQRGHDPDRAVEEKGSGDNYSGFHELAVALLSAVAAHLLCTKDEDATGLSRGMSRSLLSAGLKAEIGCHGLVPWRLTLEAK